jgi:hypothetical protein
VSPLKSKPNYVLARYEGTDYIFLFQKVRIKAKKERD